MELTLGEKIRLLREEKELNQTQLGQAIHMTQRKVSYLENNRYEPSLEDLKALCAFFGVSAVSSGFPQKSAISTEKKVRLPLDGSLLLYYA